MTLTEALERSGKARTAALREALTALASDPTGLLSMLEALKAPARKAVLSCVDVLGDWPLEAVVTLLDEVLSEAHDRRSTVWHALMPVVSTAALVASLEHARDRSSDNRALLEAELIHRMGDVTNQRLWNVRLEAAAAQLTSPADEALAAVVKQAMGRPRQVRDALERVERTNRAVAEHARKAQLDAEQAWVDALSVATVATADVRPTRALPAS